MTMSRKEFMSHGLAAFGRMLMENVRGDGQGTTLPPRAFGRLRVDNGRCLAQRGGCFACIDHCPRDVIGIQPGVGIVIDQDSCDGCGVCIDYCPLDPKVITLQELPGNEPGV